MKQNSSSQNYLEYIPKKKEHIRWNTEKNHAVTLLIENTGFFNRTAQFLFHRPRISRVHLDGLGSFVWNTIDGKKNIITIGKELKHAFPQDSTLLYERLAAYLQQLADCNIIEYNMK